MSQPSKLKNNWNLTILFAGTLFISASLMFVLQPLFGKLLLPLLGGSPAVWNTCMVFFPALLLAGYGYAHLSTTFLGVRKQALVHMGVMLYPFCFSQLQSIKPFLKVAKTTLFLGFLCFSSPRWGFPSSLSPVAHPSCKNGFPVPITLLQKTPTFFTVPVISAVCFPWLAILYSSNRTCSSQTRESIGL